MNPLTMAPMLLLLLVAGEGWLQAAWDAESRPPEALRSRCGVPPVPPVSTGILHTLQVAMPAQIQDSPHWPWSCCQAEPATHCKVLL
jgi:hypothetical protein